MHEGGDECRKEGISVATGEIRPGNGCRFFEKEEPQIRCVGKIHRRAEIEQQEDVNIRKETTYSDSS